MGSVLAAIVKFRIDVQCNPANFIVYKYTHHRNRGFYCAHLAFIQAFFFFHRLQKGFSAYQDCAPFVENQGMTVLLLTFSGETCLFCELLV